MIILLSWVCFFKAFYFEVSIDSYGIIKIDVQYAMAHHPAPVPMSMYFTVNSVCACACVWVANIHIVSTGAHGSQKRLESRRSWTTRCRSWALKPGPQQEQSILLSTEPSFQPPAYLNIYILPLRGYGCVCWKTVEPHQPNSIPLYHMELPERSVFLKYSTSSCLC